MEKLATPNYTGRQRCRSAVNSRTHQRHARDMESIRERSLEINRAQSRSKDVINRVHRFLDDVDIHYRELENYERMKNMRILHR